MFGFLKKRANSERQKVIEEFTQAINAIKGADKTVQLAVGHGLNMANSFFFQKFHNIDAFKGISKREQLDYLRKLGATEEEIGKKDPQAALGFGLFKMWIASIIQNDEESMQYFSNELAWLSKAGDLSGT